MQVMHAICDMTWLATQKGWEEVWEGMQKTPVWRERAVVLWCTESSGGVCVHASWSCIPAWAPHAWTQRHQATARQLLSSPDWRSLST